MLAMLIRLARTRPLSTTAGWLLGVLALLAWQHVGLQRASSATRSELQVTRENLATTVRELRASAEVVDRATDVCVRTLEARLRQPSRAKY